MKKLRGAGCGCVVVGISIGIILTAIIPANAIIFTLALLSLALGCCLIK